MLRLAIEGAFDRWQGKSASAHLEQFETMLREQRPALTSIRVARDDADYAFLIRRAQAALDIFGETVSRDIVNGVDRGTDELAFYAALNRVKERAIQAADCIGSIQIATS